MRHWASRACVARAKAGLAAMLMQGRPRLYWARLAVMDAMTSRGMDSVLRREGVDRSSIRFAPCNARGTPFTRQLLAKRHAVGHRSGSRRVPGPCFAGQRRL